MGTGTFNPGTHSAAHYYFHCSKVLTKYLIANYQFAFLTCNIHITCLIYLNLVRCRSKQKTPEFFQKGRNVVSTLMLLEPVNVIMN